MGLFDGFKGKKQGKGGSAPTTSLPKPAGAGTTSKLGLPFLSSKPSGGMAVHTDAALPAEAKADASLDGALATYASAATRDRVQVRAPAMVGTGKTKFKLAIVIDRSASMGREMRTLGKQIAKIAEGVLKHSGSIAGLTVEIEVFFVSGLVYGPTMKRTGLFSDWKALGKEILRYRVKGGDGPRVSIEVAMEAILDEEFDACAIIGDMPGNEGTYIQAERELAPGEPVMDAIDLATKMGDAGIPAYTIFVDRGSEDPYQNDEIYRPEMGTSAPAREHSILEFGIIAERSGGVAGPYSAEDGDGSMSQMLTAAFIARIAGAAQVQAFATTTALTPAARRFAMAIYDGGNDA